MRLAVPEPEVLAIIGMESKSTQSPSDADARSTDDSGMEIPPFPFTGGVAGERVISSGRGGHTDPSLGEGTGLGLATFVS